jgi:hypothetical protein
MFTVKEFLNRFDESQKAKFTQFAQKPHTIKTASFIDKRGILWNIVREGRAATGLFKFWAIDDMKEIVTCVKFRVHALRKYTEDKIK